MNIGKASELSGVSSKMIRYYESIGLIAEARRTATGYRDYSDNEVETLRFIRRARDLGFSVKQMQDLVSLWQDNTRASADVKRLALEHVTALEEKARKLHEMSNALMHLAKHCHGDSRPACPIINSLASGVELEQVATATNTPTK